MDTLNGMMRGGWTSVMYVLLTGLAVFAVLRMLGPAPAAAGNVLSPAEAHDKAMKGEVVLVDVRTPDEWKQTGVAATAHTITMHQQGPEFLKQLDKAMGGDRNKPLAVICRTGNRTGSLVGPLEKAGYTSVINVAEGMVGGRYGQGWIKAGLPMRQWAPGQEKPAAVTQAR